MIQSKIDDFAAPDQLATLIAYYKKVSPDIVNRNDFDSLCWLNGLGGLIIEMAKERNDPQIVNEEEVPTEQDFDSDEMDPEEE